MVQKTFTLQLEDNSPNSISYEVGERERLWTRVEGGIPFVFANGAGMLSLAKLLIKLGMGDYKDGFHVHIRSDFSDDAGERDAMTILLDDSIDSIQRDD